MTYFVLHDHPVRVNEFAGVTSGGQVEPAAACCAALLRIAVLVITSPDAVTEALLFLIVNALNTVVLFVSRAPKRAKHARQNGDNRDDNQQLNQSESCKVLAIYFSYLYCG